MVGVGVGLRNGATVPAIGFSGVVGSAVGFGTGVGERVVVGEAWVGVDSSHSFSSILNVQCSYRAHPDSTKKAQEMLGIGFRVERVVGFGVGLGVVKRVGLDVGWKVGLDVGGTVGLGVGKSVGICVGKKVGIDVGLRVGSSEGEKVWLEEGDRVVVGSTHSVSSHSHRS